MKGNTYPGRSISRDKMLASPRELRDGGIEEGEHTEKGRGQRRIKK